MIHGRAEPSEASCGLLSGTPASFVVPVPVVTVVSPVSGSEASLLSPGAVVSVPEPSGTVVVIGCVGGSSVGVSASASSLLPR